MILASLAQAARADGIGGIQSWSGLVKGSGWVLPSEREILFTASLPWPDIPGHVAQNILRFLYTAPRRPPS